MMNFRKQGPACIAKALFVWIITITTTLTVIAGCGSSQERPEYTEPDTVGVVSRNALVGSWKYTVLNPSVPEENDTETIYTFKSDGTFVGLSKPREITMEMKSTGTWRVEGETVVMNVQNIEETSGDPLASLAVAFTRGLIRKQTGSMNPYSITKNRIVMVSNEHDVAVRLDRM